MPYAFEDIFGITMGGVLVALALVLALMEIPFGRGLLNLIAFVLIGHYARRFLRFIEAVDPQRAVITFYGFQMPLDTVVYYSIVGLGFVVTVVSFSRRRPTDMLQAVVGYVSFLAIDVMGYIRFLKTLGEGVSTILLTDVFMNLMLQAAEGMRQLVSNTTQSLLITLAVSWVPVAGQLALALAIGIVSFLIGILTKLVTIFRAYMSRLYSAAASFIATIGDGTLVTILTVLTSYYVSSIIVAAYIIVYGPALGLMIWTGLASAILYLEAMTSAATALAAGLLIGGTLGRWIVRVSSSTLFAVGGRLFRETSAILPSVLGILVALGLAKDTVYPFVLATATALVLGNAYLAARLVIGVPRRRVSRYMSAIFDIVMLGVATKYIADLLAKVITAYLDSLTIPLGFFEIDLTVVLEQFPIIGEIIRIMKNLAYNLSLVAADP